MTNVVNIEEERQKRLSVSQTLQEGIDALDAQITKLQADQNADNLAAMAKLYAQKAALAAKLERALVKEEREAKKAAAQAAMDELDMEELKDATKAEIRAWLKDNDYYYTHSDASYWLYTPNARQPWSPHSRSSMVNHDPRLDHKSPYFALFTEVLQEDGRWFRDHAMTFAKVGPETLNMLRWNFLKPKAGDHHWVFDALMTSIGGGKQENIDHIEQVIVAKLTDPSNYTLPTIVMSDDGGTGKSLLAEKLLPVIFGKDLVASNVSMDEITGQFNGHLQGKAVWFVNENRADKNDHDGIKRVLGSATLRSERKGKDAKLADNTALMFVAGNFSLGAIKLSGTEVDRRFSILKTEKPLKFYTSQVLGCSEEDAHKWMWDEGQHILSDPDQVAMWLNNLIERHGPVRHVIALHGADYRDMLEAQMDTNQQVYKAFFTSDAWKLEGYFKQGTMFAFYRDYCKANGIRTMSNQRFYLEAEAWLRRKKIDYERLNVVKWGNSTAAIFWNPQSPAGITGRPTKFDGNDGEFFSKDPTTDRITWKVEID